MKKPGFSFCSRYLFRTLKISEPCYLEKGSANPDPSAAQGSSCPADCSGSLWEQWVLGVLW